MNIPIGLREELEALLSASASARRDAVSRRYQSIVGDRGNNFVLFGTGFLGRKILRGLRSLGIEPLAFADNNPDRHGRTVDGLEIHSPESAFERFGRKATFIPSVFTHGPLVDQLEKAGVSVLPTSVLSWQFPQAFLPFASLALPESVLDAKDHVLSGLNLWDEARSMKEYVAQVAWRTSLDPRVLPQHLPQDQIYFADDLFDLGPQDVVVDCGAFDGDTLRAVLKRTAQFSRYYGAEPDSSNRVRLAATIQNLAPDLRAKCSILPFAVGDRPGIIRFNETGSAGSSVSDAGEMDLPMETLDNLLEGVAPTFIKMDIEGAEQAALAGARGVIRRAMPILAICLYHRPDDLWAIPRMIKEIAPEYRLFLRRYCNDLWEQVCYAVPPGRLKG